MSKKKSEPKITVACAGCGRTQEVRKSKIVECDYYTCSGRCNQNPDFQHPLKPDGFIHVHVMCAAGSFTGHQIRPANAEEWNSVLRARQIYAAGLRQLSNRE